MSKLKTEHKDTIQRQYNNLGSLQKVSELYNVSSVTMWRFAKKNNIKIKAHINRKYSIDENVFSSLNEYSEYWIGFLYADGHINVKRNVIFLYINAIDKSHIQNCLKFFKTNYKTVTRTGFGFNKYYKQYGFQITNKKIINDLISYGFTQRKSWNGSITNKKLLNSCHFWRGMLDGDGSIGFIKKDIPSIGLIATKKMSEEYNRYVYKYILFNNINRRKISRKKILNVPISITLKVLMHSN